MFQIHGERLIDFSCLRSN